MNDRELEHEEKIYTMLYILYPDLEKMPVRLYQEAAEQANWFIDAGTQDDEGENVRKMDWTQDEPIIFPAVNAVAGRETRAEKYMHWWTFLGYFMEIREGVFATVVRIRTKKLEGKTLDKWEKEFYRKNKKICDLIVEKTEQEKQGIENREQGSDQRMNDNELVTHISRSHGGDVGAPDGIHRLCFFEFLKLQLQRLCGDFLFRACKTEFFLAVEILTADFFKQSQPILRKQKDDNSIQTGAVRLCKQ